jgi:hypothetical protein
VSRENLSDCCLDPLEKCRQRLAPVERVVGILASSRVLSSRGWIASVNAASFKCSQPSLVQAVEDGQWHGSADHVGRFAAPSQCARVNGVEVKAGQAVGELRRLRPAGVIQVSICAALQAMPGVPIGFPVPRQIHVKR